MIALEQRTNLICDAVCLDRWTTACLDAVRIAALSRFACSINCWFQFGSAPDTVGEMQHASSYVHVE